MAEKERFFCDTGRDFASKMEVHIMQDVDSEEMSIEEQDRLPEASQILNDDPAAESSQVPDLLIASDGDESDSGFAPEYVLATERQSPSPVISYPQEAQQSDTGEEEELLESITQTQTDGSRQQIVTIIHGSDEVNNLQLKDSVSKEMLKRFVIDAKGIHPSVRPIDAMLQTGKSNVSSVCESGKIEMDPTGHRHVVIFSTANSDISSRSAEDDGQNLTIALVQSEENTFPAILGSTHDGGSQSSTSRSSKTKGKQIGLDMAFEVVTELESPDGEVVMREITTQTSTPVKRQSRKRKFKVPERHVNAVADETESACFEDESSMKRFKCTKCNLKFIDRETCDVHMRCHVPMSKNYQCSFCDFADTKWTKMHQHLFKHGVEKPLKCSSCTFSCRSRSDLTAHMTVHSKVKEFSCNKCHRFFKHRRNVVAHQRTCPGLDESGRPQQIEGQEKFICGVCRQLLSSKKNLDKHMEIHMNLKPYVCDKCGHSTRLKESLIMHKRLHTGEKPFKCDFCEYATPDKSSLRRHKRTHTNEKPYKCKYCTYGCIQKHCLDTHIRRKHTGEQFVCGLCQYATHDRYGLNQHFKRHQNADGCIVHEIEVIDEEKCGHLSNFNPPSSSSTTYIALPSGAVLKSTTAGKNTIVEESLKKPDIPATILLPKKLQTDLEGSAGKDDATGTNDNSDARNSDNEKDEVTVELGQLEASLLQQIQQPGDEIFVQPTGEIVIRRQDGHLLVIQRQDIEEDETNDGHGEGNAPEYLTAVPPSEISGTIEGCEKQPTRAPQDATPDKRDD